MQQNPEFYPLPQFIKDIQRLNRLDSSIMAEISEALDTLLETGELPREFQDHELTGAYAGYREFHIRDTPAGSSPTEINDVLVIYRWRNEQLTLVAVTVGSHKKLFSGGKGSFTRLVFSSFILLNFLFLTT